MMNISLEETCKQYLECKAQEQTEQGQHIAEIIAKKNKNYKEMAVYVEKQVREVAMMMRGNESGMFHIDDEYVFGWAVEYFEDDSIKPLEKTSDYKTIKKVETKKDKAEEKKEDKKNAKKDDDNLPNQIDLFSGLTESEEQTAEDNAEESADDAEE